jgi:hypothetical protein
MNVDTNHLIQLQEQKLKEYQDKGYEEIPPELYAAAQQKLAGRSEVYVSKTSGGKLSKWAADKRKAKRKMAKQSRKRNRR